MVLQLLSSKAKFSGLVIQVHATKAQGIYSLDLLQGPIFETLAKFYAQRGVDVAEGYRPGLGGSATGKQTELEQFVQALPGVGKLLIASWKFTKLLSKKVLAHRKKQLRPFRPAVGIHIDVWQTSDSRPRGDWAALMETLDTLPQMMVELERRHPGISISMLITQGGPSSDTTEPAPPIRIDGNSCSEGSMVSLVSRVKRDRGLDHVPTHYWLFRWWGLRNRVRSYRDTAEAFKFVHLFPDSQWYPS